MDVFLLKVTVAPPPLCDQKHGETAFATSRTRDTAMGTLILRHVIWVIIMEQGKLYPL